MKVYIVDNSVNESLLRAARKAVNYMTLPGVVYESVYAGECNVLEDLSDAVYDAQNVGL